jgi:D-alanyl-D-alanine carboxypeptidase (penicillin-binding protein 5/6)
MGRVAIAALAAVAIAPSALAVALLWPERAGEGSARSHLSAKAGAGGDALGAERAAESPPESAGGGPPASQSPPGVGTVASTPVTVEFKDPPSAGLLFEVDTGEVLWKRAAGRPLPIASLTKLMTALLISEHHRRDERVLISRRAARTGGSKLGVLPVGRKVPLWPLFNALILPSANDAAVALAEHHAGSVRRFVARMNRRARLMGLGCSRFSGPSGLKDRGNRSCALDLATLARAALSDPWIARLARTRRASFPFPGKVRRLDVYNNHYFLTRGVAGVNGAEVTGLKTGYTIAAGRCYMTTARLGSRHLGVILLDSPDPIKQVPKLLRRGFSGRR